MYRSFNRLPRNRLGRLDRRSALMSREKKCESYRALRKMQARHTYVLLTAAVVGMALTADHAGDKSLSLSHNPLILAVVCWGMSFFYGCRYVSYVGSELYLDHKLLGVQRGEYPDIGDNPALITLAEKRIRQAMYSNSRSISSFAAWQLRFLIWGGLLYVAWFVLEMYLT
jgi:hypothetical protein